MTISFLITKSLGQDIDFLCIKHLPVQTKFSFILQKYLALAVLFVRNSAHISLPQQTFSVKNYADVATIQASIIDFYSNIASLHIITSKNPIFVDIGGHIGQSCAAMKFFFPTATIHSFEADPDTFTQLQENSHTLSNTTPYNVGIGNKNETRRFYKHTLSGMSSFKKYEDYTYAAEDETQLGIKRLDDILAVEGPIDLLKIDIEGFELQALQGGIKVLQQAKYLVVEIGLGFDSLRGNNLETLSFILTTCPKAKIIKMGRPLGINKDNTPMCQDVVIQLH